MCCKGTLKRLVPFFITLAIGLFIASFFVDLAPRPFAFGEGRRGRRRDYQELQMQYLQEREKNERLQQQLDELRQNPINLTHVENGVSDIDVPPPPPAKAPRVIR